MAIYLDDEPVTLGGTNLAEMLTAATDRLRPSGRMIVEVLLDGQTLTGDELNDKAAAAVTGDTELRLYSADPRGLAGQVLEQVRAELLAQQSVLEQAADFLQQDKPGEAFKLVNQINEVWLATMRAVEQASPLLGVDLMKLNVDGKPFIDCTKELLSSLQQFRQQLQDQDTAALADALGFEWPRLIEQWDAVLATLLAQANATE